VSLQAVCSAFVLFIHTLLDPYQLMEVFTWLMGRVPSPSWPAVGGLAAVLAVSLALLLPLGRELNAVSFGERDARALGVDVERLKRRILAVAALLVGAVVAWTGLIGFVGIVVPHALRMLIGPDHRRLLPAAAAAGGLFLMIADTLARSVVPPVEVPVGVLTALVGGPFFLVLLRRRGAEAWPA
jgi:iron complex transport system permease protein